MITILHVCLLLCMNWYNGFVTDGCRWIHCDVMITCIHVHVELKNICICKFNWLLDQHEALPLDTPTHAGTWALMHTIYVWSWPVVTHTQMGTLLHSSSSPVIATSLHSTQSARSSQTTCFTSFVPDKDLRRRNVVRCSYLLRESPSTQLSYMKS